MARERNLLFVGLVTVCFATLSHAFINQNCDHKCVLSGNTYCGPIPCPYFACDVPLEYTKGDCCEHCPTQNQTNDADTVRREDPSTTPCPFPCTQGGKKYCNHIPCPFPPCAHPVTTPGECCPHCPDDPSTTPCPFSCTQGGRKYCHQIPCAHPPCADTVTTPGECCPHCPNGPTCTINGVTIHVGDTKPVGALTCHCKSGGIPGQIDCV